MSIFVKHKTKRVDFHPVILEPRKIFRVFKEIKINGRRRSFADKFINLFKRFYGSEQTFL